MGPIAASKIERYCRWLAAFRSVHSRAGRFRRVRVGCAGARLRCDEHKSNRRRSWHAELFGDRRGQRERRSARRRRRRRGCGQRRCGRARQLELCRAAAVRLRGSRDALLFERQIRSHAGVRRMLGLQQLRWLRPAGVQLRCPGLRGFGFARARWLDGERALAASSSLPGGGFGRRKLSVSGFEAVALRRELLHSLKASQTSEARRRGSGTAASAARFG